MNMSAHCELYSWWRWRRSVATLMENAMTHGIDLASCVGRPLSALHHHATQSRDRNVDHQAEPWEWTRVQWGATQGRGGGAHRTLASLPSS